MLFGLTKMLKLKKLKIGGHIIAIELVDTSRIDGPGTYNDYHNKIRLRYEPDLPVTNLEECLLHEIIECIKIKNNLTLDHKDLTVISEMLYQVLSDNDLL